MKKRSVSQALKIRAKTLEVMRGLLDRDASRGVLLVCPCCSGATTVDGTPVLGRIRFEPPLDIAAAYPPTTCVVLALHCTAHRAAHQHAPLGRRCPKPAMKRIEIEEPRR